MIIKISTTLLASTLAALVRTADQYPESDVDPKNGVNWEETQALPEMKQRLIVESIEYELIDEADFLKLEISPATESQDFVR